ncbi:MAG: hypothetical protein ACXW3L_07215, partial [Limisphaerales bacterium]
ADGPSRAMLVFQVYLNGKKVSTVGVGDLGVLSAHVSWVRRKGEQTRAKKSDSVEEELTLHVGGLSSPTQEQMRWLDRDLKIGDEVRIIVAEDSKINPPRSRERRDRAKELRAQKRYVKEMAKKFGWRIEMKP